MKKYLNDCVKKKKKSLLCWYWGAMLAKADQLPHLQMKKWIIIQ